MIHQVNDKKQFLKCGNGKSFLAETKTFQPTLRDGTLKEPEFEPDNLEIGFNQSPKNAKRSLPIESTGRRYRDFDPGRHTAQLLQVKL